MRTIYFLPVWAALLLLFGSCEKLDNAACNDLPHNNAPASLSGGWANGFTSFSKVVDAYNGRDLGSTWSSGKYFRITPNGKNAEFYYTAQSQFSYVATKAEGTIEFDPGSDAYSGSFVFHACKGHFRGWGSTVVDRKATDDELSNQLTRRYYYEMQGNWLRIQPDGPVNNYSSSFKIVD